MTNQYPEYNSSEYFFQVEKIKKGLVDKFAWSAQHQGIIYRADPMLGRPMRDYEFNRISRAGHSFRYLWNGKVRTKFYRMEEIVSAMDDPELDIGFLIVEGVEFLPGEAEVLVDGVGRRVLNLWQKPQWGVIKSKPTPNLFLVHLEYLFDGDNAAVEHVLDFLAHMIQRPAERVNHALLVTSQAKGIGKSTLGSVMRRLVGESNSRVAQAKDLSSQFDGWLVGKLLIQIDEIYEHGNWHLANKMKSLITEPSVSVNLKHGPQLEVHNYARMIMFSNHSAPIDLESGDRRYWVFDSKAVPRSMEYYEALNEYIGSEDGMNEIYSYLMARDISRFKPYAPPPLTAAKEEIIAASGNPLGHYLVEAVQSGHLRREFEGAEFTLDKLQRTLTKDGYGQHSKNMKELGAALDAAGVTKHRRGVAENRVRYYRLPEATNVVSLGQLDY